MVRLGTSQSVSRGSQSEGALWGLIYKRADLIPHDLITSKGFAVKDHPISGQVPTDGFCVWQTRGPGSTFHRRQGTDGCHSRLKLSSLEDGASITETKNNRVT